MATMLRGVAGRVGLARPLRFAAALATSAPRLTAGRRAWPEPQGRSIAMAPDVRMVATVSGGKGVSGFKRVLIKIGNGPWMPWGIKADSLLRMNIVELLKTLKAPDSIFAEALQGMPLGTCSVQVARSEQEEGPSAQDGAIALLGVKTIKDALISAGSAGSAGGQGGFLCIRVGSSAPAAKSFTLLVNREDEDGELAAFPLPLDAASNEELKELIRDHGGGSMVKEGSEGSGRVHKVAQIEEGATYLLIGGQQDAVLRHRTWTQAADKVLEEEATNAVLAADTYGPLEEFKDYDYEEDSKVLRLKDGQKKEIDGMGVNGTKAVVVEAKHTAEVKHIKIVKEKAAHVERVAKEGRIERLKGITSAIPVLAADRFSPAMVELCKKDGVGVVKPNGSRLSFIYRPSSVPSSEQGPREARS